MRKYITNTLLSVAVSATALTQSSFAGYDQSFEENNPLK